MMHKVSIPRSVVDRVIARRGCEHVYADLDPKRTALVVVDMQNAFMLPGDLIVEKNRFSAFIQGSSNLAELLRARGIDTILVTGTVTGVCCESTARDAMMLNFKTVMVSDGNAAMTDEDHNASLAAFYLTFGDVMSTDMLIACLTRGAAGKLAAAE